MPVKLLPFVTCYTCNYFIFTVVSGFSSSASNDILNIEWFYTLAAHAQLPAQAQSDRDLLLSVSRCLCLAMLSVFSLPPHQSGASTFISTGLLPDCHQACTPLRLANCNLPEPL